MAPIEVCMYSLIPYNDVLIYNTLEDSKDDSLKTSKIMYTLFTS